MVLVSAVRQGESGTANPSLLSFDEIKAKAILSQSEVTAIADMKMGDACATAWGCDLTHEYVSINADYRS